MTILFSETGFLIRKGDVKDGVHVIDVMIPGMLQTTISLTSSAYICDCLFPGGSVSFHRADVQDALVEHISPSIDAHLSHRLKTYRHVGNNEIELEFTNGNRAVCDFLIGADGINSAVRRTMLAERNKWTEAEARVKSQPLWTGTVVYRDLIDAEIVRRESPNHIALTKPVVVSSLSLS